MKARYWVAISAAAVGAAVAVLAKRGRSRPRGYRLVVPDGSAERGAGEASVQFIGTATTIVRYGGLTFLTDPNFLHRGDRIHIGCGMHATRLTDPAIEFEDLPPIDFVLLSHLHEDHFDRLVEDRLPKDMPILTTASAARTLERRGFTRTCPLRRWDYVNVVKGATRLRITSMPGRHGPLPVSALLPEVMGSMLEFDGEPGAFRMYITGDTLVFRDLREIPHRYRKVDLALLHLGGTRVMGVLVTMNAEHGIQALQIVGPDTAIPIHYDDYDVFKEPLDEFARAVKRAGLDDKVQYLRPGETYTFLEEKVAAPPEAGVV